MSCVQQKHSATQWLYTAKIYISYKTYSFVEQLEAGIQVFQFLQNQKNFKHWTNLK